MGVYTVSKRKRKPISARVDPDLYTQAREKSLNISAILDKALERELHKEKAPKEAPIAKKEELAKKTGKALFECGFCGLRLEGQYHILGDGAYCNTCGRMLNRKTV